MQPLNVAVKTTNLYHLFKLVVWQRQTVPLGLDWSHRSQHLRSELLNHRTKVLLWVKLQHIKNPFNPRLSVASFGPNVGRFIAHFVSKFPKFLDVVQSCFLLCCSTNLEPCIYLTYCYQSLTITWLLQTSRQNSPLCLTI